MDANTQPPPGGQEVFYGLVAEYDSPGSLIQAARAYREAGAAKLYAITTHGLFPADSLAKIRAAGLFERVVATDSHPRARELQDEFLTVLSAASLFVPYLRD